MMDTTKEEKVSDEDRIFREWMERKRSLYTNMIILHDFDIEKVKWKDTLYWFENFCNNLGVEPTKMGVGSVDGKGYGNQRKVKTYKGGKRSLEKSEFSNLKSLSVHCMYHVDSYPCDSKAMFSIYCSDIDGTKTQEISVFFEDSIYPFSITAYAEIAKTMQELTGAKYGYYNKLSMGSSPEFYSSGYCQCGPMKDILHISEETEEEIAIHRKLRTWRSKFALRNDPPYKVGDLREIYKLNFLSRAHLDREVFPGKTLESWILSSNNHGRLEKLNDNFWSWVVDDNQIEYVTKILAPTGIILCL